MFQTLGNFLSKWWILVIGVWLASLIGFRIAAPPFNDLAKGGEFVFLPEEMPSRQAEVLFNRAFPGRETMSNMVVIVYREEKTGLTDDDRTFIDDTLKPELEQIRDRINKAVAGSREKSDKDTRVITDIHTFSDPGIGTLLVSDDQTSSLVTMDVALDFQDSRNWEPVQSVLDTLNKFDHGDKKPKGLQLALTGSATLGRDISSAEAASARNTGPMTVGLAIVLLLVIYRAPLIALVPLLTLFVAVDVALHFLTVLAQNGYVPLFKGLKEYTTVITYGPGIDYCLFLIARYKENLEEYVPPKEALARSIGQVGAAIVASASTVICGIGMLTFAEFGKFHQAGIGISIALAITLVATLTLTPSLLFMTGHWAFWPKPGTRLDEDGAKVTGKNDEVIQKNLFEPLWTYVGQRIERRPVAVLLTTLGAMMPLIIVGIVVYGKVNFGLLESLPKNATSAAGARVLEHHFPAGITGPVGVLLQNPDSDFSDEDGIAMVHDLVDRLMKRSKELNFTDVRSVAAPLGTTARAQEAFSDDSGVSSIFEHKATRHRGVEHYVSTDGDLSGHVTELDFILTTNPFSIDSVHTLDKLEEALRQELPKETAAKTTVSFVGPTASVRDIDAISRSDQQRIYLLVVVCVLAILVVLLRSITLSLYLIVTVLLSYLATIGVTWLFFYGLDPKGFIGLDWTVPLFLFVVLIAVGEDYNIFLVTRIHEEQKRNGPKHGIAIALSRTGGIITSCGFIMVGTFASLCVGSLARMQQLGVALAVGVLLDTFVIRPILVPAFMMMLNDERYGNLARYLK